MNNQNQADSHSDKQHPAQQPASDTSAGEAGYGYGGEAEGYDTQQPERHRDNDTAKLPEPQATAEDAPTADDLDRRG